MTAPDAPLRAARGWVDRVPLRTRLVAIVTGLLLLALLVIAVASLAVLRPVLVNQVDSRLVAAVQDSRQITSLLRSGGGDRGGPPSDYVARVSAPDGTQLLSAGDVRGRRPDLSQVGPERARDDDGRPFTLDGWRVVAREVQRVATPTYSGPGLVTLALPLNGVEHALEELRVRLVVLGLVVVAACALLGWLAVRRSFRPLEDVEEVAEAFGSGETSRRVRALPASTEVGRLGHAVNAMLDNIETSLAARDASERKVRRFVADASHELRTPLAAVRGFAELYRQGAVRGDEDVARTMRRIEDEATRMGGLVEDLLVLARLDEQRPMRHDDVDLLVIAADAVHDSRALASERTVRLEGLEPGTQAVAAPVVGDDARLRQVLANLVANAVRHTPARTPVQVGVGIRDGWSMWRVVDHGPGIPEDDAERVFERFFRADTSRHRGRGGGSGLGLAIVAAVVRAHGGDVRVVPTPGGGATVEVAVPTRRTAPEVVDLSEPVDEPSSAPADPPG